jgi:hypothetical protein
MVSDTTAQRDGTPVAPKPSNGKGAKPVTAGKPEKDTVPTRSSAGDSGSYASGAVKVKEQRAVAPGVCSVTVPAPPSNVHVAAAARAGGEPAPPLACHSSTDGAYAVSARSEPPLSSPAPRVKYIAPASAPAVTRAVRSADTVKYATPPSAPVNTRELGHARCAGEDQV